MTTPTPPAEWKIDEALVRDLLREQQPDLAALPLQLLDSGFDNEMLRLGDSLLVRLPRRATAVPLIGHEQSWLPELAPQLPIPVPVPLRVGAPSERFPHPWSVLPWLAGKTADLEAPASEQAGPWADFLLALHRDAPADAPRNPYRGVPLRKRQNAIEGRLEHLRGVTDIVTPAIESVWSDALAAPESRRTYWIHGDLHARNVLVEAGGISGVVDWGDLAAGDRATDLASIWMLFEQPRARADALARYAPSQTLLARALGWAISFGVLLLDTGLVDHPRHAVMGEATLRRVMADTR